MRDSFYQVDSAESDTALHEKEKRRLFDDRQNRVLIGLIEEELKRMFAKEVFTNYPKIVKHLNACKALAAYRPLEQSEKIITYILVEKTVSINDTIYMRNLEDQEQTVMRNLIFKSFGEKPQWRKQDIKKAINSYYAERGQQADEEILNKLLSQYTATYNNVL